MSVGRRYKLHDLLGEGSFGAVYLATTESSELRRPVAIKVLHREKAEVPGLLERMRDEARILSFVQHRAIVRVDDLIELDGNWAIVMEYVEGCDVLALIKANVITAPVAVHIAEEVALALHTASRQVGPNGNALNLVHRDVKPSNIRVSARGEVKLLDFGVARAEFLGREAGSTTMRFGTLSYMSPERCDGTDSHAGDVYALGVSLFEMLTGTKPGQNAGSEERQPPGAKRSGEWAAIRAIDPDLHKLVAEMLAFKDADRPTALECARRLREIKWTLRGQAIEEWAEAVVPAILRKQAENKSEHPCSGVVLTESSAGSFPPEVTAGAANAGTTIGSVVAPMLPWMAILAFAGSVVLTSVVVTLVVLWPSSEPVPEPTPVAVEKPVEAPKPPPPAPVVEEPPAPVVEAPPPAPVATKPPEPRRTKGTAATPAAVPAETPTTGKVRVVGATVEVVLKDEGGTERRGNLPPGKYTAKVTFAGGETITVRNVAVEAGRTTALTCSAEFNNCRPHVE